MKRKKWVPNYKQKYYFLNAICNDSKLNFIIWKTFRYNERDSYYYNCFRTKREAQIAANKIKKVLKGEL